MPKPAAAFSPLTTQKSMASAARIRGSSAMTASRPVRPSTSPKNSNRMEYPDRRRLREARARLNDALLGQHQIKCLIPAIHGQFVDPLCRIGHTDREHALARPQAREGPVVKSCAPAQPVVAAIEGEERDEQHIGLDRGGAVGRMGQAEATIGENGAGPPAPEFERPIGADDHGQGHVAAGIGEGQEQRPEIDLVADRPIAGDRAETPFAEHSHAVTDQRRRRLGAATGMSLGPRRLGSTPERRFASGALVVNHDGSWLRSRIGRWFRRTLVACKYRWEPYTGTTAPAATAPMRDTLAPGYELPDAPCSPACHS